MTTVVDDRGAQSKAGVKQIDIVSRNAPLKKGRPESKAWMDSMRAMLNEAETVFIDSVARGRGVTAKTVKQDFGQGSTMLATSALQSGMIDGIMRLDDIFEMVSAVR